MLLKGVREFCERIEAIFLSTSSNSMGAWILLFKEGGSTFFGVPFWSSGLIIRFWGNSTFTASAQIKASTCLMLLFDSKSSIMSRSLLRSRKATFPQKAVMPHRTDQFAYVGFAFNEFSDFFLVFNRSYHSQISDMLIPQAVGVDKHFFAVDYAVSP